MMSHRLCNGSRHRLNLSLLQMIFHCETYIGLLETGQQEDYLRQPIQVSQKLRTFDHIFTSHLGGKPFRSSDSCSGHIHMR
jgi:hypothetical protein